MDDATRKMHLRAGEYYGRTATCGDDEGKRKKVNYGSEETADGAARALTTKKKKLEAYPCHWCEGWHIGRAMTPEEITRFAD